MAFRRHFPVSRGTLVAILLSCLVPAAALAQQVADSKSANKSSKSKAAAPAAQGSQKLDVAGAQSIIESASKLLAAGKTEPAAAQLSTVISSGNLPAAVMARALHLRGSAYRQQGKPALAIADLTSALWLKGGLSEADRADATQQRAAAYGEAGLTEQGQAIASTTKTKSTTASPAPAPAPSSGGLFAGLFGGSASTAAPKEEAPKVQSPPKPANTHTASNWTAATKPAAAPDAAPASAAPSIALAHAPHPPATHPASGHAFTRVALVRTQSQAQDVVAKLKQHYASALGNHSADIGQATFGNMGSFFEVAIGPFKTSAEAQALCTKLKGSGLDCVPLTR